MTAHRGLAARALHLGQNADLQQVKAEAAEHLEGWKRARADYQNLQQEMERRLTAAAEEGKDALLQNLFSIIEYFDAAVQQVPENLRDHDWVEGVRRIHQAFQSFLKQAGVMSLGNVGEKVDPALHEAIAEEHSLLPAETITAVTAHGYMRNGRVLQPARVRVSSGPHPADQHLAPST